MVLCTAEQISIKTKILGNVIQIIRVNSSVDKFAKKIILKNDFEQNSDTMT